jgi:hypothetical protein
MNPRLTSLIKCYALILLVFFQLITIVATGRAADLDQRPVDSDRPGDEDPAYIEAIQRTSQMTSDGEARRLTTKYGLDLINVTWEDTGRYKGSSVGPNISDATIQVQFRDPSTGQYNLSLMPVIRYPNFSDLTADLSPDRFYLMVGNEKGQGLEKISLREYLGNIRKYLHDPESWSGPRTSLLSERDSHVLVSAQAAFLPVPQAGKAEFNPVLFNYQSYQGDPAVLVIVATREGTSATVIDNVRDGFPAGFSWGQRLFFNQAGERAGFTGERLSDFTANEGVSGQTPEANGESGLNMVLLIQVPLKQKRPMDQGNFFMEGGLALSAAPGMQEKSDVETAVIGHGPVEGPFTEIDGLDIERDRRFPVRVVVQFYKATSNGIVSEADMQAIAEQIQRVYDDADYVGSLVVDGETERPTEYDGSKDEPSDWWQNFWKRFEENTNLSRDSAIALWRGLQMNAGKWFEENIR